MENSWENHGKIMGKSWENHGKIMGKSWENHGKFMGNSWENHGKSMGKAWENHGKMQEIPYKWRFIAGKHIDGGFDGRSNDGIPNIRGNLMVPRIFQQYSHYILH